MIGFGVGGGIGLLAGFSAECHEDPGQCIGGGVRGLFVGAAIGEALLLPVGVHLVNRRQGRLEREILLSLGAAAVGVGAISVLGDSDAVVVPVILSVPTAQLLGTITEERRREGRR
jgi:hypothetical protein